MTVRLPGSLTVLLLSVTTGLAVLRWAPRAAGTGNCAAAWAAVRACGPIHGVPAGVWAAAGAEAIVAPAVRAAVRAAVVAAALMILPAGRIVFELVIALDSNRDLMTWPAWCVLTPRAAWFLARRDAVAAGDLGQPGDRGLVVGDPSAQRRAVAERVGVRHCDACRVE